MLDNPLIEKISSSHQSNCTIIATSSNIKYNKQGEGGLGMREGWEYGRERSTGGGMGWGKGENRIIKTLVFWVKLFRKQCTAG